MVEPQKIFAYSLKLLGQRPYSKHKLSKKLIELGHSDEEITTLLNRLNQENIDIENDYLKRLIRKNIRKNFAPSYIIQKCRQEKIQIDETIIHEKITELYQELNITQNDQIKQIINKKLRQFLHSEDSEKKNEKILRSIVSKGHPFRLAQKELGLDS